MNYKQMERIITLKSSVPEGQEGDWKIEKFIVDEQGADSHNFRESLHGRDRNIKPGTYTRLMRNSTLVMSDTYSEKSDSRNFLYHAKGDILINGLGLGWAVEACLHIPEVKHITVIEISEDVLKLVCLHLQKKYKYDARKIHFWNADALTYCPPKGKIYDAVWHDIWDNICGDNWESMKKLHRKYGKRSKWQGSWCRKEIKYSINKEKSLGF